MKRVICLLLFAFMLVSLFALPVFAASFQLTYYEEAIYAGGVVDLYVFVDGGVEPFSYQWQYDVSLGKGHWYDLEDNEHYTGTKTDHLRMYTNPGSYSDWDQIPFQCVVTDAEGTVCYTPDIFMVIYPTEKLIPAMKSWGYQLYEPTLTNVTGFQTDDYVNYTAWAFAGSKVSILCGSKPAEEKEILRNSEVKLTREIHITENGHTTKVGDQTTYIPYTVGADAVTVEIRLRVTIGEYELGDLDCKAIRLSTTKPTVVCTAATNTACSLLRYTYNESQKLASIPKGATVEVLGKEGSYYQVFYNNYVGYVGASLLNVQQPSYDPVIRHVEVTIPNPVAGEKPVFTCNILTEGCQLYKTEPVTWYDKTTGEYLSSADTFREGHSYDLVIWLAAKSGYKFQVNASGKPQITGAINGDLPPFINRAYEQDPEEVIELTYTFHNVKAKEPEQSHTCTPVLVERVEPTCTQNGHEAYYYCACGMHYRDAAGTQEVNLSTWGSIPATGHTSSGWRTTQVYHYTVCTACGDMLEQEDHRGGTATCTEKAKCGVCGYAYGREDPDHRWGPGWDYRDTGGHAWVCADCKAHSEVQPHNPGPEATETTPQTCKDCGYILTAAKTHTHELIRVPETPADCTHGGNMEYYFCVGCNDCFTDAAAKNKIPEHMSVEVGALGHTTSENWSYDTEYHWRTCGVCSVVLEETRMLHETADGKCNTCGYAADSGNAAQQDSTTPTQAEESGTESGTDAGTAPSGETEPASYDPGGQVSRTEGKQNVGWAMAVMIGLVCFGASVTATVIILKRRKK